MKSCRSLEIPFTLPLIINPIYLSPSIRFHLSQQVLLDYLKKNATYLFSSANVKCLGVYNPNVNIWTDWEEGMSEVDINGVDNI